MLPDDPKLKELIHRYDMAFRSHRKFLLELFKLYLKDNVPDTVRTAILQQAAHESETKVKDMCAELSEYCWSVVPYSKDPEHLEQINKLRDEINKRILNNQKEERIIITRMDGRTHVK